MEHELSPETREVLRRAAFGLRFGRAMTALVAGVVTAAVLLGGWLWLDAVARFGPVGRWAGFVLVVAPCVAAAVWAVRQAWRRFDASALARRLEVAQGRQDNAWVNAVQMGQDLGGDSAWRPLVMAELAPRWEAADWKKAFRWRVLERWLAVLGVIAVAVLVALAVRPEELRQRVGRVLMPAAEIAPVTRTRIVAVEPGDHAVSRGESVAMRVTVEGQVPEGVWLVVREDGGTEDRMAVPGDGRAWSVRRKWSQAGVYWFEAGDARSFPRRIEVMVPARLVTEEGEIIPPAYTKLPRIGVPAGGVMPEAPAGSDVSLRWKFDRGLDSLTISGAAVKATRGGTASEWSLAGRVAAAVEWQARWKDDRGLTDEHRVAWRVKPDLAPVIRVSEPAGESEVLVARDGWVRIGFEASDDHGLAEVRLCRGDASRMDAKDVQAWKPGGKTMREAVDVPVSKWVAEGEGEAWFCVVAVDGNDVTGPGRTVSRPVVVRIVSAEELARAKSDRRGEWQAGLEDLVSVQRANLEGTRAARAGDATPEKLAVLVERQTRVEVMARDLLDSSAGEPAEWRSGLAAVVAREMPEASAALRAAAGDPANRGATLARAEALEVAILARLRAMPAGLEEEAKQAAVRDLIARLEDLFRREKSLHERAGNAGEGEGKGLAAEQDAVADDCQRVRGLLEEGSADAALGDAVFRALLGKAAKQMVEVKIYEEMLRAAERMEAADHAAATTATKRVLVELAKILEMLRAWQSGKAGDGADATRQLAEEMKGKLDDLVETQRGVVEKSKELASKDQFRPEDVATAKDIAAAKKKMEELIEQMLIDAHAFPDLNPMNEVREELTKIYEDVIQQDKEAAAAGQLKPQEIAVQKEEGMLEALEKAAETFEDMEMWLPNKNETAKWLMENFDLTEMPEIPNLPLADSFTDLVGDLLEEQQGLAEQVQDAASNEAFAVNPANGWEVADGPMPGFNAQGRSGNTRPNENEQTGRSSGGREGMSSGEMVNETADRLEGSASKARRTNDPMQQGQIKDDGPAADAKATGGGKAGGVSQREGMTGAAPQRPVAMPRQAANDALAVAQAMLSQQTAKSYATARLYYLKTGPMPEVAKLMDESREALRAGRLEEFQALHRKIVAKLGELRGGGASGEVEVLGVGGTRMVGEKRVPGGAEAGVPAGYRDEVEDYYRGLDGQ